MSVFAWHFVGETLRDGRPVPPDGEWLTHDGVCVLCESGLHASRDPFDALYHAPGARRAAALPPEPPRLREPRLTLDRRRPRPL